MKRILRIGLALAWLAGAAAPAAESIHEAAAAGDLEKVRTLLKADPSLVSLRYLGTTPLHEAARNGQLEMVRFLVASGADVNILDSSKLTPLKLAMGYGRKDIVKWLREHGGLESSPAATVVVKSNAPPAPLAPPVPAAPPPALQPESRPAAAPSDAGAPILSAPPATGAHATNPPVRPAPAQTPATSGPPLNPLLFPIHQAAEVGEAEQVKALIKQWPELIEAENEKGLTPLHVAAANGRKEVVAALLARRANVGAKTRYGWVALHFAATRGDAPTTALLLSYRAQVNVKTRTDDTPLHMAVRGGHIEVAKLLLERKADPDAVENVGGLTPLHLAVVRDSQPLVELLIAKGAEVNKPDARGETPLTMANFSGYDAVSSLLQRHGGREAEGRPLTPLEQGLVDYYRKLDQTFRTGSVSERRKAALSMVPTRADAQKLFPAHGAEAVKVADQLLREVKAASDKDLGVPANEGEIWKLEPGPASPYVQYCQSKGLIASNVPIYTLTVKMKGRKSLLDMYCHVNNHWVPLPPVAHILPE